MGSSNNLSHQALLQNKLLQMKILDLKHKAALYELGLGSIASILKDLPAQHDMNEMNYYQKTALLKIANVLTHIDTVVRRNSNSHRSTNFHQSESAAGQNTGKVQQQPAGKLPWVNPGISATTHYIPGQLPPLALAKNSSPSHANSGSPPNGTQSPQTLYLVGENNNAPPNIQYNQTAGQQQGSSTLSILKCRKSPEEHSQSLGAMTISPIMLSRGFLTPVVAVQHSIPTSSIGKSATPPTACNGAATSNELKRQQPFDQMYNEQVLRKKAAIEPEPVANAFNKERRFEQFQLLKQAMEQARAIKQRGFLLERGEQPIQNSFGIEKDARHAHICNGGNVIRPNHPIAVQRNASNRMEQYEPGQIMRGVGGNIVPNVICNTNSGSPSRQHPYPH